MSLTDTLYTDSLRTDTTSFLSDSLPAAQLLDAREEQNTLLKAEKSFPSREAMDLPRYEGLPMTRFTDQNNWVTGIILFVIFLFWAVWRFSGQFFALKTSGLLNIHSRKNFVGDEAKRFSSDIVFVTIHILVLSLFLYQIFYYLGEFKSGIGLYLYCVSGLVALHSIKYLINRYLTYVFYDYQMYTLWKQSYNINNYILGILFIPVVLGMVYGGESVFELCLATGGFVFLLLLILYVYRLFVIFFKDLASLLYLILYLCALEIIPIMIGYKLVFYD